MATKDMAKTKTGYRILTVIKENPSITRIEIAEKCNLSMETTCKYTAYLRKCNFLSAKGDDTNPYRVRPEIGRHHYTLTEHGQEHLDNQPKK